MLATLELVVHPAIVWAVGSLVLGADGTIGRMSGVP